MTSNRQGDSNANGGRFSSEWIDSAPPMMPNTNTLKKDHYHAAAENTLDAPLQVTSSPQHLASATTTAYSFAAMRKYQQRTDSRVLKGATVYSVDNKSNKPATTNNKGSSSSKTAANANTNSVDAATPTAPPVISPAAPPVKAPTMIAKARPTMTTNAQPPSRPTPKGKQGGKAKNNNNNKTTTTDKTKIGSLVQTEKGDDPKGNETKVAEIIPEKLPSTDAPQKQDIIKDDDGVIEEEGLEEQQPVANDGKTKPTKPTTSPNNKKKPNTAPATLSPHSNEIPPVDDTKKPTAPSSAPQKYWFPPPSTKSSSSRPSCQSRHPNNLFARLSCQASSTWSTHPIITTLSFVLLMIVFVIGKRCCCGSSSGSSHPLRPRRDHRGEYRQLNAEFGGDNPFNDDVSDFLEDGGDDDDDDDDEEVDLDDLDHETGGRGGKFYQAKAAASNGTNGSSSRGGGGGIELSRMDHKLSLKEMNG
jgi:hypothetical protein